jgi:hypothetical protein
MQFQAHGLESLLTPNNGLLDIARRVDGFCSRVINDEAKFFAVTQNTQDRYAVLIFRIYIIPGDALSTLQVPGLSHPICRYNGAAIFLGLSKWSASSTRLSLFHFSSITETAGNYAYPPWIAETACELQSLFDITQCVHNAPYEPPPTRTCGV